MSDILLQTIVDKPLKKEVRNEHHINTGIIICTCLVIILACCGNWIYSLYNDMEIYKANDIKYRYIKLNMDNNPFLSKVDSLYKTNKNIRRKKQNGYATRPGTPENNLKTYRHRTCKKTSWLTIICSPYYS